MINYSFENDRAGGHAGGGLSTQFPKGPKTLTDELQFKLWDAKIHLTIVKIESTPDRKLVTMIGKALPLDRLNAQKILKGYKLKYEEKAA